MPSITTILMQSAGSVDDLLALDVNILGTRYLLDQHLAKLRKDNLPLTKTISAEPRYLNFQVFSL
jgi:hypothetical protein